MQISKRLSGIADMVTPGNHIIDVGTDHAYLPISLIIEGKCPAGTAMDINEGPLERAREHIETYGLSAYIETRLSDGVDALKPEEGDSLVIAGMGGFLLIKILSNGRENLRSVKEYILQPQSEVEQVRRFLHCDGYRIIDENMIEEDGKFYPIIKTVKGSEIYDKEVFYQYGKILLEKQHQVLQKYLQIRKNNYEQIICSLEQNRKFQAVARKTELKSELKVITEVLETYFN